MTLSTAINRSASTDAGLFAFRIGFGLMAAAAPVVTDPLALLNTAELAHRAIVVSEFNTNGWNPNIDAITWDDTVAITSESQLYSWLNGTAVGGVTRNVARNQRVQLTKPFTNDRTAAIDRLRGNDWTAAGKALLIESANPSDRVTLGVGLTNTGSRGIYIRRIGVKRTLTQDGANTEWVAGANSVTVTNGGTGFAVGDILTLTTSNSNMYNLPTLRVTSVSGGVITGLAIDDTGLATGTVTGIAATSPGGGTGAVVTVTVGVNPRDTYLVQITRSSTFPQLPVMIFDDVDFGLYSVSTHPYDWYSIVQAQNADQLYLKDCKFNGYQTAVSLGTIRRFKAEGCDFQNGIGDVIFGTNARGDTAITGVGSFNSVYPDKLQYCWLRLNTVRNLYDGSTATTPGGKNMGLCFEHTDTALQLGTATDTGGYRAVVEYHMSYAERVTYKDSVRRAVRLAAQTQGNYLDDTTLGIDILVHNCIVASMATATFTGWNGTVYEAFNTGVRTGHVPPTPTVEVDGFAGSYDARTGFYSRKLSTWAGVADHYIRKSLMGIITTQTGSGILPGTLYDAGDNVIVNPAGGPSEYQAAFPALGATADYQGKMQYDFTDDGAETQAAFRARMYAAFGKSYAGVTNPAIWS